MPFIILFRAEIQPQNARNVKSPASHFTTDDEIKEVPIELKEMDENDRNDKVEKR